MSVFITDKDGKLKKVAGNFAPKENPNLDCLRTKILWTNPNPTSAFSAQTITLNSSDYDYLLFISDLYLSSSVSEQRNTVSMTIKGRGCSLNVSADYGGAEATFYRTATYINDTQYNISGGSYRSNTTTGNDNSILVPIQVIGLKKQPAMIYTGKELFNDPVSAGVTRTGQHDTVSEYYVSSDGNTWYRKWASGWKECGGKIAKGISGQHKVTFPLTFSNTSFTLLKTLNWQFSEAVINRAYFGFQDITESYAYTYSYTADGYDESWYACGY